MGIRIGRCRLPQLLKQARMTQIELAEELDMSVATISHYVTNRRIMSLQNAKILADYFGIPIDDLYEWAER